MVLILRSIAGGPLMQARCQPVGPPPRGQRSLRRGWCCTEATENGAGAGAPPPEGPALERLEDVDGGPDRDDLVEDGEVVVAHADAAVADRVADRVLVVDVRAVDQVPVA